MNWRNVFLVCLLPCVAVVAATRYFSERAVSPRPPQAEKNELSTPPKSIVVRKTPLSVRLLETGDGFHGDQVNARSGETWLGLYVNNSSSALIDSRLIVRRVYDPIVDDDERSASGKSVSVDRDEEPLLLVKNAPGLKPGPVATIFYVQPDEFFILSKHPVMSLKLGMQSYQLKLVGTGPGADSILPLNPQCVLSDGTTTQVLRNLDGEVSDIDWTLLWAGDLDGDGKLDLYADLRGHYNTTQRKLFLSSQAKPGQLVAEVGEFLTSGC